MYCCYIIYSKHLDKYYVGHTENIELRLVQHNSGESTYTSKASDWVIVYKQFFEIRKEANLREIEIKKRKSRSYIISLISSAG